MSTQYDILVLGGGPAGYSAAIHAAKQVEKHGLRVGLVESRQLGGTCLNRGCIPTKTLLESATFLDAAAEASKRGIEISGPVRIDLPKTMKYKERIVKRMSTGIGVLLRENRVAVVSGKGTVRKSGDAGFPFAVSLFRESDAGKDVDPGTGEFFARKLILATGSEPARPPIPGLDDPAISDRILTSDELLDAEALPASLVILGGGVIGVEMARVFKAFGIPDVSLVEAMPRLVPFLDTEISVELARTLNAQKIKVLVGRKLERVERTENGLSLHLDGGEKVAASHLLVAVGRSPKTDMLSDDLASELNRDRRGGIPVDWRMRTSVPGLFAPGDVNGKCMLAHAAIEMGRLAADSAVEELLNEKGIETTDPEREGRFQELRTRQDGSVLPDMISDFFPFYIPGCIYGNPEVGFIGWTEDEARKQLGEDAVKVGRFPFAANGRASSSGHRDGFVKVVRHRETNEIVGVHLIGPCASELINEVSAILYAGGNVNQWAASIHAHPTYGEALVEAAADSLGQALHLPPKNPPPLMQ